MCAARARALTRVSIIMQSVHDRIARHTVIWLEGLLLRSLNVYISHFIHKRQHIYGHAGRYTHTHVKSSSFRAQPHTHTRESLTNLHDDDKCDKCMRYSLCACVRAGAINYALTNYVQFGEYAPCAIASANDLAIAHFPSIGRARALDVSSHIPSYTHALIIQSLTQLPGQRTLTSATFCERARRALRLSLFPLASRDRRH